MNYFKIYVLIIKFINCLGDTLKYYNKSEYNGHTEIVKIPISNNKIMQNSSIQNELSFNRIARAFESIKYTQRDYITALNLRQSLTKLSNQQYDQDIFDQLWEQCKLNSQGQVKVGVFIQVVIKAQNILISKESQCSLKLKELQAKLTSKTTSNSDKIELNRQFNQLTELRSGYCDDLQVIKRPFLNFSKEQKKNKQTLPTNQNEFPMERKPNYQQQQQQESEEQNYTQRKTQTLQWLFYNAWICLFTQIIIYLYINVFMNSVLSIFMISLFLFQHIDRRTVRFIFWFTVFTLIVDIVWYVVEAKNIWNPHNDGLQPYFLNKYLKLVVILYSFEFAMKVLSLFLLWSQYNINEQVPRQVNICGSRFILKFDNNAPLQKALAQLDKYVHRNQPSDKHELDGALQLSQHIKS